MTYNMHAMGKYMDENREKLDDILDYIMREKADVVALQEYDSIRCQVLQQRLATEYPYYESMPSYKFMGGNAVYSKFEIISCKYGVLTDKGKEFKIANDSKSFRKINPERLIMLLEFNVKGKKVRLANCHFESNNIDERIILDGDSLRWYQMLPIFNREIVRAISVRKAEAELLNKWAKQNEDVPVIVCGDLNDFGGSPTLRTLQNHSKLKDAWWNGGLGYGATYHGHKFMYFRLDHILYNNELQLQKVRVA
ncbi:MAG: endonuclease/exonuclease/phosphatase family protein [Aeriscardovia sp.]|nr:endonuclease/exonuclease/phosphatase family protein [Aeriscardovia sp.]